jgi:predicted cobalt transporter CbtA
LLIIRRRGWQHLYFIYAAFNVIPVIGGYFAIPPEPAKTDAENRKIDWVGAVLVTVAMSLLTFSITQSGLAEHEWRTPCKLLT